MLDIDKPMEAIEEWQNWYRGNSAKPVITTTELASIDKLFMQKAKEHFADTIAEFANELTAAQLYQALYEAAKENVELIDKEYQQAKKFFDRVRGVN